MIFRSSPSGSLTMRGSLSQTIVLSVAGSAGSQVSPRLTGVARAGKVRQAVAIFCASEFFRLRTRLPQDLRFGEKGGGCCAKKQNSCGSNELSWIHPEIVVLTCAYIMPGWARSSPRIASSVVTNSSVSVSEKINGGRSLITL
jgi:hypothetical protein